ncbi:bile acid:sodium symporter family protein [Desertibaculum subflavum]|uniref:bile acid:sodium symporter family protein n=1 Tax=Desertibaculum subflavum TaxID=2268458 RepID=UPI000E663870
MRFPRPDKFSLSLIAAALIGSALPASGWPKDVLSVVTQIGVGLVFFLHGANLSREAVLAGLTRWKLHLLILAVTFVAFPLAGLGIGLLAPAVITPALAAGVLFLCCVPSTVQASVALTGMAGGNVPAAVCSASASNLIGVVLTPALIAALMQAQGFALNLDIVRGIVLQLLLPFLAGQVLRPRIGSFIARHKKMLQFTDRGSILLIVYGAFGAAMLQGLWRQVSPIDLAVLFAVVAVLLASVLAGARFAARAFGFDRADMITATFCGSTKSLATGVPLANILFAGQGIGMIVLPLMLYHQLQLITCSYVAQRYAQAREARSLPAAA